MDDIELLREYTRTGSEPVFAALVDRHAGLVYSAALRQVRDPHHAEDITQAVFLVLARKANRLTRHPSLSGWLLLTTRYAANAHIRAAARRSQREQEAAMQSNPTESSIAPWPQLEPLLDEAMASLGETDRTVLALRYFENRTTAEISTSLKMNEEAAKKRAGRALEKLRKFFTRRGVLLSAATIAGAISANSVQAAPAGMAAKISVAAGRGLATGTSITSIANGVMKTMMWNNLRMAGAIGAAIILAAGTTTLLAQRPAKPAGEIQYRWIEDAVLFEQSINHTNLVFHFLINSSRKGIKPKDIHLMINSSSRGKMPIQLGSKGQILNFPCDDDLRQENPGVTCDQPTDSLAPGVWVWVPVPDSLVFHYDRFVKAVDEANQAAARAHDLPDSNPVKDLAAGFPKTEGIALVYPAARAGKAKISIATAGGTKEYVANSHGIIQIKINPTLQAENPLVTISEKPSWISIWPFPFMH